MPQMMPMLWMFLMLKFNITLFYIIAYMYFFDLHMKNLPKNKYSSLNMKKKSSIMNIYLHWYWKW